MNTATDASPSPFDLERYTTILALVGVVGVTLAFQVSAWFALLAIVCFYLATLGPQFSPYLFGPFLHWELLRFTRRQRVHLWRPLLALVAGLPLLGFYFAITNLPPEQGPPKGQISTIAGGGFLLVFWILFVVSFSLIANFVAQAVADDRESKRLDFLLATDLRGRELVIGKVLARTFGLLAYPAAALPMIMMMPWLFQLDPALILYCFAYGGVTILSFACLNALGSVLAKNKKMGSNLSALLTMPYFVVSGALMALQKYPAIWFFPGSSTSVPTVSVGDLIEWFGTGNPITLFMKWPRVGFTGDLGLVAADFPAYATFHSIVGLLALLSAARMLRRKYAEVGDGNAAPNEGEKRYERPAVWSWPVAWKELYYHPLIAKAYDRKRTSWAMTIVFLTPAVLVLASAFSNLYGYAEGIRGLAPFLPVLGIWIVVNASARFSLESIARERERDTMLNLLLTSLEPRELLIQKMLGLCWMFRVWFVIVLCYAIAAVIAGTLPWWALPAAPLTFIIYTATFLVVGFYASATAPNVTSANITYGKLFGFYLIGVVVVGMLILLAVTATGARESPLKYLFTIIVPPGSMVGMGLSRMAKPEEVPWWIASYALGLVLVAGFGYLLWRRTLKKFVAACTSTEERGPLLDNRETPTT
jgi:ABC-type Na+ efflux pump permease subunit